MAMRKRFGLLLFSINKDLTVRSKIKVSKDQIPKFKVHPANVRMHGIAARRVGREELDKVGRSLKEERVEAHPSETVDRLLPGHPDRLVELAQVQRDHLEVGKGARSMSKGKGPQIGSQDSATTTLGLMVLMVRTSFQTQIFLRNSNWALMLCNIGNMSFTKVQS